MPLSIIRWRKPDKFIFAGVIVFGALNLLLSVFAALGVPW